MKIKCPSCSSILSIADSAAGTVVQCQCGKSLRAPSQAVKPSLPSAPTTVSTQVRRTAVAPTMDPGLFDALSESDLQPLKQVHRPGQSSNPYQATASAVENGGGPYAGELASLGKRFLGALVDQMIYFLAMAIGFVPVMFLEDLTAKEPSETIVITVLACFGLALIVPAIINAIMITKSGQSIGKKAVGIRIVDDPTRKLPGFVKGVLVRSYVTAMLTQFVPFFGLVDIAMIFGEDRKCLHDKIASTIVIDAQANTV